MSCGVKESGAETVEEGQHLEITRQKWHLPTNPSKLRLFKLECACETRSTELIAKTRRIGDWRAIWTEGSKDSRIGKRPFAKMIDLRATSIAVRCCAASRDWAGVNTA